MREGGGSSRKALALPQVAIPRAEMLRRPPPPTKKLFLARLPPTVTADGPSEGERERGGSTGPGASQATLVCRLGTHKTSSCLTPTVTPPDLPTRGGLREEFPWQ